MARVLIVAAILACCFDVRDADGVPHGRSHSRHKRHMQSDSVNSLLQHFIGRLTAMDRLIREQENMMRSQLSQIRNLRWLLRETGSIQRLDEIKSDVEHQKLWLEDAAIIKPFVLYKTRFDMFDKRFNAMARSVDRDYKSIHEIYRRVLIQKKISCRRVYTPWHKKAGDMIGALANHPLTCDQDELLQMFLFQRQDGSFDGKVRYMYKCCRINIKDKWTRMKGVDN